MMNIKNCPFCGQIGQVTERTIGTDDVGYFTAPEFYEVECTYCEARAGLTRKKTFRDFCPSDMTVAYFRNHSGAYQEEDKKYKIYKDAQKNKAIALWNAR